MIQLISDAFKLVWSRKKIYLLELVAMAVFALFGLFFLFAGFIYLSSCPGGACDLAQDGYSQVWYIFVMLILAVLVGFFFYSGIRFFLEDEQASLSQVFSGVMARWKNAVLVCLFVFLIGLLVQFGMSAVIHLAFIIQENISWALFAAAIVIGLIAVWVIPIGTNIFSTFAYVEAMRAEPEEGFTLILRRSWDDFKYGWAELLGFFILFGLMIFFIVVFFVIIGAALWFFVPIFVPLLILPAILLFAILVFALFPVPVAFSVLLVKKINSENAEVSTFASAEAATEAAPASIEAEPENQESQQK